MAKGNAHDEAVFLHGSDALATGINTRANELYRQLTGFDVSSLDIADEYKDYFINHHLGRRLFFSLQNSAHIIYHSVKKTGKPASEISFIDYGAGLGTLFMLAGMMGFKQTIYNDYLPDWQQTARSVCEALQIKIDGYVTGDIDAVMEHAAANNLQYDIVASRNVIEHIYSLPHFYSAVFKHNSKAVTYSTTTANYHNPVMRWYHVSIHNKGEKNYYRQQRKDEIKKLQPSLNEAQLTTLAGITRGKAQQDFIDTVHDFVQGKQTSNDSSLRSNTCDCVTGVWNEHLLTKREYAAIISKAGFKMEYTPGYWDTHYRSAMMNVAALIFNRVISVLGNKGIILSPFVNVNTFN